MLFLTYLFYNKTINKKIKMANKKSIVEEALLEAKQIEEALKKNSKGLLAGIMQKDIDQMVKASIKEGESPAIDQQLGEAYYLRGMIYFYLCRISA